MELKKFLGVLTIENIYQNDVVVKTVEKDRYPKFSRFCKEVMDPIREDLDRMANENLVDFTFDYEPVYKGVSKRGDPDEILFKIKLSELGQEISHKRRLQKLPADIWDLLRAEYKLTETDVRMLTDIMPNELVNEFRSEVLALRDRMMKYKVKNPKSYVVTSLKNFIMQHTPEETVKKQPEKEQEKKEIAKPKPISEEEKNCWTAFMELLRGSVPVNEFNTWLTSLEFVSLNKEGITISVPAAYVGTYIDEKLKEPFRQALNAVYGENVMLYYDIRSN